MRLPEWAKKSRTAWRWTGAERPPFADTTDEGQESVWDYPRPPLVEPDSRRVVVRLGGTVIADTTGAIRVLETASPPAFYLPRGDVRMELMRPTAGSTRCEWKGLGEYWTVRTPEGDRAERAAWSYPEPFVDCASIRGYLAFYPGRVACFVEDERVTAQGGGFYGGWITSEIRGPFKGDPGAGAW